MKTTALGEVIRFAESAFEGTAREGISYEADAELRDLEESHAEMARALMDTAGYYRDVDLGTPCWCGLGVRKHRPHDAQCEAALSALRKAGLL